MTTPKSPQDRKPSTKKAAPKPSEVIDAELEGRELREELLKDMPPLRPPHRFRISHKNRFNDLILEAVTSGAFGDDDDDEGPIDLDMSNPKDIKRLQAINKLVESIDAWAESIADDPADYAAWAEGKDEETILAIFITYREALGKSSNS